MAKNKKTLDELLQEAIVKDAPYEVPGNWVWSKLMVLSRLITGNTPSKKKSEYYGGNINFVKPNDLSQGRRLLKSSEYLSDEGAKRARIIPKGSTAVCCIGSIGKCAFLEMECATNQQINSIIPNKIDNLYMYYYVLSDCFQNELIFNSSSTTISIINKSKMEQLRIPVPPLKEQKRIVEKIESLFAKLDKAKELIEEVRGDFEKRKAAILEKAFRGELTEKWREENKYLYQKQYFNIGEVCDINPKKDILNEMDDNTKCTFVPMTLVSHINGTADVHLTKPYSDVKKGYTFFKENDIIFAKITPCMENGKTAIVKGLINKFGFGSTEFHVIRCRSNVLNKYIYYLLRSKMFRNLAKQNMTGAVGQQRVPKDFIQQYNIWLPPLEEQKEIVRILDKLLDEESKIEKLTNLQNQIELTKKSILAKAFRGELGTNNPGEESAIELLKEVLQENI